MSKPLTLLYVTQWFDPEPFFKGLSFARALRGRGYNVEVLTGFPNYPEGRIYEGYRLAPYRREILEGIPVHRAPLFASHDTNLVRRAATFASFALSASAIGACVAPRADLTYVYHPPATVALPGILRRLLRGTPYVLEVQDLWPDSLLATHAGKHRLLVAMLGRYCRFAYRAASRVVVSSPGVKRALVARGIPVAKVEVVPNWCEEGSLGDPTPHPDVREGDLEGRFTILFAGNVGPAQDLSTLLSASRIVWKQHPEVQFLVAGTGTDEATLRTRVRSEALANVRMLGRIPPQQVAWLMEKANALLVLLRRQQLFEITIPSKTQAYLFAGRPILMGVLGDAADLVRQARAGLCFEPGNPEALAAAVHNLLGMGPGQMARMSAAGREYYREHLSSQIGIGQVDRIIREVLQEDRR